MKMISDFMLSGTLFQPVMSQSLF